MYLAVDIGGTKTLLASFTHSGELIKSHKFATPTEYSDFIATLKQELTAFSTESFVAAALAVPGRLDRKTGVGIAFGSRPWQNVPIRTDIEAFVTWPLLMENDTKLAGLSEALLIKNDYKKVLYVTLSTGISSALIVNGKIDPETQDSESGQMLLEHEGRLRDWEDFASGRAFREKFGKPVGEITDPGAWYIIAHNIALGLINLIAAYTPEVIVLGGGVGSHLEKFQDRLTEELKIYENPLLPTPPIRKAARPEEAVVYGCYALLHEQYGHAAN
jgi:predicted NBD/HSP70 family sugar kinase